MRLQRHDTGGGTDIVGSASVNNVIGCFHRRADLSRHHLCLDDAHLPRHDVADDDIDRGAGR